MSDKTKQQLKIENNSSFPNNNTGFITPDKLRTFNENVIDSFLVNDYTASNDANIADLSGSFNDFTQSYYVDSASFDSRISAVDTSSYVTQTEFDTFETQSNQRFDSIEQFTASIDDDFVTEQELAAATGALENEIATKADQTDFTAYTSSNDSRVSSIENTTASLETKFDTLATTTSSLQDFTASADDRLDNIESNTGSYARTDTTNQFQQTQTLEQDLIVEGNLYVSGAEVIISSSELIVGDRIIEVNANKVIGDAGLYAFDAIGDQTGSFIWNPNLDYWLAGLSGSEEKVLVSSDTASIETSLNALNNLSGSLLQTASNDFSEITLTKVDGTTQVLDTTPRQVVESVKNGNGQQLQKGTPVYASGSVGNAQLVFPASASDATTMPAVYILAQTLDPGEEGLGYTHGFINGVNTSLFNAGEPIYVGVNGGYTNQPPTGSTNLIQKLGTVVRSDVNNGSGVIQIDSIRALPNIQEGYLWVGDSDGVPQQIATSSIEESTDLSSLNAFTASADNRLNNLESETGSYLQEGDEVISGSITSGFMPVATGNHSLDNSVASIDASGVFAVGSIANPLPFPQIQMRTDSDGGSSYAAYQLIDEGSGSATAQLELTTFDGIYGFGNPVNRLRMGSNTGQHPDGNVVFVAPSDTSDVQWYKDALFTQGTNIRLEDGDIEVSGSITISEGNDLNFGYNTNGLVLTSYDDLDQALSGYDTSFGIINKGLNNNQSPLQQSIAIGAFSLGGQQAQSGSLIDETIAFGTQALTRFEAGTQNIAIGGNLTMAYLTTGSFNTAIGGFALQALGFGTGTESHERNTGIGMNAGNTAAAGGFFTGGFGNTFIGANTSPLNSTTNFETVIGAYADGHGENTTTIGSINNTQETYILGDTFISGSNGTSGDLDIEGAFTSSLTEGYVLVGDSNNRTYEVSTGSFGGGGSTDISSLNAFTASQETLNANFAVASGSNSFTGDQTFGSGDFTVNGTQVNIQSTTGFDFGSDVNITFESRTDNIQFLGDARFNSKCTIDEVLKLEAQDPLPVGSIGELAVSGSELFFYNGAWTQIS